MKGLFAASAASLVLLSPAMEQAAGGCAWWGLGHLLIQQSNNITVSLDLSERNGQVSGQAEFYSTSLRATVPGVVSGTLSREHLSLRIAWNGRSASGQTYRETGVYAGPIDGNGQIAGYDYPDERPGARTTFTLRNPLSCVQAFAH